MKHKGTQNTRKEAVVTSKERPDDRHAEVARRAYELFERRGGERGHEIDDWLEAERSLREDTTRKG
jgi:Protein of unknown function (DUF2934)